jgi:hypothetical protein
MSSLKKLPTELIDKTVEDFCNELWNLSLQHSEFNRYQAQRINGFEEDLKNFIIKELFAASVVEIIEEN